jgi:hypothetical protein
MSLPIVFEVLIVVFCLYGIYSTLQKKKQIYVIYHRITGQIFEGFVKVNGNNVDIDNKRFTLLADRRSLVWWNKGIHAFFGTYVIAYEFSHYSKYPHDPKNYTLTVVSPAVAKVLNNEARMGSFARGVSQQGSGAKKGGMFEKYLPYILVALVLILIVFIFQMHSQIGALTTAFNTLKNGTGGK